MLLAAKLVVSSVASSKLVKSTHTHARGRCVCRFYEYRTAFRCFCGLLLSTRDGHNSEVCVRIALGHVGAGRTDRSAERRALKGPEIPR